MVKFRRTAPAPTAEAPAPVAEPTRYVVLDGSDSVVDYADTHTAALRVIDWMVRHDHTSGPFRCVPVTEEVAR